MRLAAATAIVSAAASAVFGIAAQSRAQEVAWLGGHAVQVAAQRMGLNGSHSGKPLLGFLARPNMPGRHPGVVILHGCAGFRPYYPVIADVLKSYGHVALALDSLGELEACNGGSGDVAESFDSYAALDWLAQQDFVDPDRVAVLGFSMGGNAALDNVETGPGAIEKTQSRYFRAAIACYPYCRYRAGMMTVPTLILVGDKDDWTLADWCRDMMARRDGKGAPVKLVVYPGATHAFNIPFEPSLYLGHHLAYDPQATAAAWKEVRSFLQTTLVPSQPGHRGREKP